MNENEPKFYQEEDGHLEVLKDRNIAIIGYGNQGRAQALNLRDSGVSNVFVGNVRDNYWEQARRDGFHVLSIAEAAEKADVIFLLLPDEVAPRVYGSGVATKLNPGDALVFASGYNLAYGFIRPPEFVDILLLAPRMIGQAMRRLFVAGEGFVSFVSVEQDASGQGWTLLLALAKAIGSLRAGAMSLSAIQEAHLDLFMEQGVGPVIGAAITTGFRVGFEAGFPPEALVLELYLSGEMAQVFKAMAQVGFFKQASLHSRTSQFGSMMTSRALDRQPLLRHMKEALHQIMSGAFAQKWHAEQEAGYPSFARYGRLRSDDNPITKAENRLRANLRFPSEW